MNFASNMLTVHSKALMQQFAVDYLAWVQQGAPEPHIAFSRGYGLCASYQEWLRHNAGATHSGQHIIVTWFGATGSPITPFGGPGAYALDQLNRTMHTNPLRLAWLQWAAQGLQPQQPTWRQRLHSLKQRFGSKGVGLA